MNLKLIDSHFHLPDILKQNNCKGSQDFNPLTESLSSIVSGIEIGTIYNDLEKRTNLLNSVLDIMEPEKRPKIYISAGMGPWEVKDTEKSAIEEHFKIMEKTITQIPIDFVGECGFDFFYQYGSYEAQKHLFELNLEYAKDNNKKIIIHSREAEKETIDSLKKYPSVSGVLHCYSGGLNLLKTALDLGYKISYAGNITYKANVFLRDTLRYVPLNRLLIETDAPYLTPVPNRGQSNSSKFIIHTYDCISEVLNIPLLKLSELIFKNFLDFTTS